MVYLKYEDEKRIILEKSNSVAAARKRQNAWQRIADCVNALSYSSMAQVATSDTDHTHESNEINVLRRGIACMTIIVSFPQIQSLRGQKNMGAAKEQT